MNSRNDKYDNHKTILLPCISLADLIEQNGNVMDYLNKNLKEYKDIDNVVLGCTHYPLIKNEISKVLGNVKFYDGSDGVSRELVKQLNDNKIKYNYDKLEIKFIDSSNNLDKEKRFYEILNK